MEANVCDINHLDADVLLPPRKRLLAGLKKQNSDVYSSTPSPPTVSSPGCEFDTRLNNLLKSHFGDSNRSNEEIAEASRLAAVEAAKAAKAARAIAEEKAAKAAKAVAAAKSALALVATFSDEGATSKDKHMKRNKMKKHVPVQMLYNNKKKGTDNCRTDEELARTLHRAINSSPRILKNSTPDSRNQKHKRLKRSSPEKTKSTSLEGNHPSTSNGNGFARERECDAPISEKDLVRVDLNTTNKADHTKIKNGEASQSSKADYVNTENKERESIMSKEKFGDSVNDNCSIGRKKGRLKQKKLPLSICSFRDQASPKEDLKSKSSLSFDENISKGTTSNNPVFPLERASMWKCQAFKAPACVEQNKVMQS
ncbi:uncharacterized protein LOC132039972 [Lycium ferocissimum]|uniref:uncharacterized protein LOC132039972 n=1 Tax=Lycium ferocissimum TaxID=112874 RepID=UPI002815217B|nr:uncharacterized protein LOC132039972 [Lycium ferocissimum]